MRLLAALTLAVGVAFVGGNLASRESVYRWKLSIHTDAAAKRNPSGRLELSTQKGKQVYWYVVYTIKNTHDEAIPLNLNAKASTDASDLSFNEGYYPNAVRAIQSKFGNDVMDNLSLNNFSLEPGKEVRAVAVFQLFEPSAAGAPRRFEERVDQMMVKFDGVADVIKRTGLETKIENVQLQMHFEKKGDQYDPARESVVFVKQEEVVLDG